MGGAFLLPAAGFRHLVAEHFKSITVGIGHGAWGVTGLSKRYAPCAVFHANNFTAIKHRGSIPDSKKAVSII